MRPSPLRLAPLGLALAATLAGAARADYTVTNLVSNVAGLAAHTDPNLRNPWGASASPTGPFWVSNQASNTSTLYNGAGVVQSLVVTTPTVAAGPNGPTGQVFNGNAGDFLLSNGRAATFLFANLNGQIDAWNGGLGTAAQAAVTGTNAIYTGLAIGAVGGDNVLFAADARGNKVDVYSSTFANLNATTYAGAFVDPQLAAGFKVFNVANVGGTVYVTYDNPAGGAAATNGGVVAAFDLQGHFLRQLISNGPGGPLEDPWGVVLAPTAFGKFGGDLLVGNKENGRINAFDPTTGAFLGLVATITNDLTNTNNGLWALTFGNDGAGGDANTLYAFAGIDNEADGLIASVTSVPEPGSIVLTSLAVALAAGPDLLRRGRRRRPAPAQP